MDLKNAEMLDEYKIELENKKQYTKQEIETLISGLDEDTYNGLRSLFESQMLRAYEIASTYSHDGLTLLDFIHAANEGLEVGVTSREYSDYGTFIKKIEDSIKSSIDLMLSFFEN